MPLRTTSCIYDRNLGMFRVTKSKGKSISNGGFGVSWPVQINAKQTITSEYLFIEEALFLQERGLVDVFIPNLDKDGRNEHDCDAVFENPADTRTIYDVMLHELNMPLSIYLTYTFLRSQTFIVVRHTVDRLNIITKLEETYGNLGAVDAPNKKKSSDADKTEHQSVRSTKGETKENGVWKKKRKNSSLVSLRKELRKDAFHAPEPPIFRDVKNENNISRSCEEKSDIHEKDQIAFDCYDPNGNFRKTNPGRPDFYVAITCFSKPSPALSKIKALVRTCDGVPLRIASVSDGGTVVMFGITDSCVPSLRR